MTPQDLIRRALAGKNGQPDPYQAKARDALCRIANAVDAAETECLVIGEVIAYFLEDTPGSLCWDTPARQADVLAKKLIALSNELRKGVKALRALRPYADQFDLPSSAMEDPADGDARKLLRREGEVQSSEAAECPF